MFLEKKENTRIRWELLQILQESTTNHLCYLEDWDDKLTTCSSSTTKKINKLTHHRQGNWHVLCCPPDVKKAYRHMYQVQLWFDNFQTSSFTGDFENNYSGNCHSNNKNSLMSSKMTKKMCYTSWYWTSSFPSFWSLNKNCLFLYMPSQTSDLNRLPVNGMDWNN